jgi:glutamine amidotransferase
VIAIIDYGMGNSTSVLKGLKKIGVNAFITSNVSDIESSSKIVLPGVGAYGDGVKHLQELGLFSKIRDEVLEKKKPFLGICLGMQLIGKSSEESKGVEGLFLLDFEVVRFQTNEKIPHVGWNSLYKKRESKLFQNISDRSDFYFVHSFHVRSDIDETIGESLHGYNFTSVIEKGNIFGTQFHPEKSQKFGLEILKNFSRL